MTPVESDRVKTSPIDGAAARLAEAARRRRPCAPIRDLVDPSDVESAYLVQSRNVEAALSIGRRVVGRKIGLTSPAVQAQLGVDQPDHGVLLDDTDVSPDEVIDSARLLQPRIEAEIAFRLARDITEPVTVEQLSSYIDWVYASFEIVDSRIESWDISLADTIADNASSGLFVLGDRVASADSPELSDVVMAMTADGVEVSSGRGSDCLGDPRSAVVWLADTCLRHGAPLRAGEIILSGALGPMVPVRAGSTYEATISGIGSVTAVFTS